MTTPETLEEVLRAEMDAPESMSETLKRLESGGGGSEDVFWCFLRAKDLHHRQSFYLHSENLIYRRLGWRLMRPLFLLAVLAALGFSIQKKLDATLGVGLFLAGAAGFFVLLQIFVHRWAWKQMKELRQINANYRSALRTILGENEGLVGDD